MNRVLIFGAGGQLGRALAATAWPEGWSVETCDRRVLDICDRAAVERMVGSTPWAAVVNAAAYTNVDQAEMEVSAAWEVNARAPVAIAQACAASTVPFVHFSSDYVFGGDRPRPRHERHATRPLGVYGASKRAGEVGICAVGGRHVILRTAWLFSATGSNFVTNMLRLANSNSRFDVVDDQRGSPTSADDLARAAAVVAVRLAADPQSPTGIYHVVNRGEATWFTFAQRLFAGARLRGGGPNPVLNPIAAATYASGALRPANSVLAHSAIELDFGIVPRDWRVALDEVLDVILGPAISTSSDAG